MHIPHEARVVVDLEESTYRAVEEGTQSGGVAGLKSKRKTKAEVPLGCTDKLHNQNTIVAENCKHTKERGDLVVNDLKPTQCAQKCAKDTQKKAKKERDVALGKEEVEKKTQVLQTASTQLGEFWKRYEALQAKVTELEAQNDVLEKDGVKASVKERAEMTLELTEEAFKNGLDKVLTLNPEVELCPKEINPGYLVRYWNLFQFTNDQGTKYEI